MHICTIKCIKIHILTCDVHKKPKKCVRFEKKIMPYGEKRSIIEAECIKYEGISVSPEGISDYICMLSIE